MERELGEATVVYESPEDDEPVETRVHYVERSVEEFEDEAATLLDRIGSLADRGELERVQSAVDDLREKVTDGSGDRGASGDSGGFGERAGE